MQLVNESLILGTDILTVDAELFQQILTPDISEEAQYHDRLQRATDNAIGYVVTPAGRGGTQVAGRLAATVPGGRATNKHRGQARGH